MHTDLDEVIVDLKNVSALELFCKLLGGCEEVQNTVHGLSLSFNDIVSLEPFTEFEAIPNLRYLDIRNNKVNTKNSIFFILICVHL